MGSIQKGMSERIKTRRLRRHSFSTCIGLKRKLKELHQDKVHHVKLTEKLNNCKPNFNGLVNEFYQRLEVINSRSLSVAQRNCQNANELPGQIKMINELTVKRFIYRSKPEMFQILRWKDLNPLYYGRRKRFKYSQKKQNKQYCKICHNNNWHNKFILKKKIKKWTHVK